MKFVKFKTQDICNNTEKSWQQDNFIPNNTYILGIGVSVKTWF